MKVSEAYNLVADKYDASFQRKTDLAENGAIMRMIENWRNINSRVLDLGCGTGLLLEYLNIPSYCYTGIDVSSKMITIARRKFPNHCFRVDDMEKCSTIQSGAYDSAVSLFGCFSYCLSPVSVIYQLKRVLADNGKFFLMLFSTRYKKRPSYILNSNSLLVDTLFYNKAFVKSLFSDYFSNVQVTGFTGLNLPNSRLFNRGSRRHL